MTQDYLSITNTQLLKFIISRSFSIKNNSANEEASVMYQNLSSRTNWIDELRNLGQGAEDVSGGT